MKNDGIEPIITIGLPTYNGEKTVKRTIDSVLAQTITNFELIISDDGSTDSTVKICREYEEKDSRIKLIQKNKTTGWIWNFIYLAKKANTKYFVWIANDDYWEPQFIEKNIKILETNPEIVCSISDIQLVGANIKNYYSNQKIFNSRDGHKKFEFVRPINGTYDEKVKNIIEFNWVHGTYSIFRTEKLKESIIHNAFASWDFALILNVVKFGDLHVLDEVLAYRDTEGFTSKKTLIESLKTQRFGWFKTYFPYIPFTIWCLRNLGLRLFLKHFSYFKYQNFHSGKKILREIINNNFKKTN
jgi:glycosyltransferase involved in cell wall biosynthesis